MTRRSVRRLLAGAAVTAVVGAAGLITGAGPGAAPASAAQHPQVDVGSLDMVPLNVDGVSGLNTEQTQTPTIENLVWDIQEAGGRIFVGGAFLQAQQGKTATPVAQPHLAAFDVDTGDWVSTCRPELDRAVYSLDVTPQGKLLVGGEFENVNGTVRHGLVALDPATCEIDPTFAGAVDRPYSENRAMVRDMNLVGDTLYIAGSFSHALGPDGQRVRRYKAAKLDAESGQVDTTFVPAVTGSGVWGMSVDPERNRVHLTGFFSGVNGTAASGNFHTVDATTGASVTGLAALPRNYPRAQPEMFDVAVGDDRVFVAGEQHILEVLDADTHDLDAFHTTGYVGCPDDPTQFDYCGSFAGGAYQFAERIGDVIFAGCHCTYATRNGRVSHYSSLTDQRTPNKLTMAYDAATGALDESFRPDLDGSKDGSWAAATDSNGCLYLGGDYKVGGVSAGKARWVGGFAKFCPTGWTPPVRDVTAPSRPRSAEAADIGDGRVQVGWQASTDAVGVSGYRVLRDGTAVGETTSGTSFTDTGVADGSYTYTILAFDQAGNLSAASDPAHLTTGAAGGDTQAPTMPTGLTAQAGDGTDVELTWTASTDNVAVVSYLIYRDGAYIGWSPNPGHTDTGAGGGPYEYTVRATDRVGNRSIKSEPFAYASAAADVTPPSVPAGVTATAAGGGTVTLAWAASTDDTQVVSYLVYRDGAYIGWSPTPGYTDTTAPVGVGVAYQLRAVDRAGNRSEKSTAVTITAQ